MKKLLSCLFGVFGLLMMGSLSHAALAISPKATYTLSYTTTVSTITAQPGAVYEVTLASGAASEYVTLFDTNTITAPATTGIAGAYSAGGKVRLFYGSTTANTQIRFDPPLLFYNGIQIGDSATTGQVSVTYEVGRGLSGQ